MKEKTNKHEDSSKQSFEDLQWIQETLAGTTGSFDNIILKYQDQVYTLILKTIGSRADAEDCAQNVFVNAFSNLKKFRMESSLRTWLFSIAVNQIRNYWRSKKRRFVHMDSDMQPLTEAERIYLSEQYSAEAGGGFKSGENKRLFEELIAVLPPAQKEIFVLYYIFGHSCEEISEILDTSPANIKIQLFRGRKRLFEKFKNTYK